MKRENKCSQFKTGDWVYVVERRADETVRTLGGYVFLGEAAGFFIVQGKEKGCETVPEMMRWAKMDTVRRGWATLKVFPAVDCFAEKADAEEAIGKEIPSIEEQLAALFAAEETRESGLLEDG